MFHSKFQKTFLSNPKHPDSLWSPSHFKGLKPVIESSSIDPIDIFRTREAPKKIVPYKGNQVGLPQLRNPPLRLPD